MRAFIMCCVWLSLMRRGQGTSQSAYEGECAPPAPAFDRRSTISYICGPDETPSSDNNYCMRDDVSVSAGSDNYILIYAGGCPDHEYFQHERLCANHTLSGRGDDMCDSSESSDQSSFLSSPYVPRYHNYRFKLPRSPTVDPAGPSAVLTFADAVRYSSTQRTDGSAEVIHPVGIAINGVLIMHHHASDAVEAGQFTESGYDFDNCGGHGDAANRYHYHSAPLCVMYRQRGTLPFQGTQYLSEAAAAQASRWPAVGKPSALLGYALDGFPVYGPYNATGDLQLHGNEFDSLSTTLNECNFDEGTSRYHFTANYPFTPPCLVGLAGEFEDTVVSEGLCPQEGIDSAYCSGDSCAPLSYKNCDETVPFVRSTLWWSFVAAAAIDILLVFLHCSCSHVLPKGLAAYPCSKVLLSVLPSLLILVVHQHLLKGFYGVDKSSVSDFSLHGDLISENLNPSTNSFLSVVGILYSLVISQLFLLTNEKYKKVNELIGKELASCRRVVLCIKSIALTEPQDEASSAAHKELVQLKIKAVKVVVWYLNAMVKEWGIPHNEESVNLERLYGVVPIVGKLCNQSVQPFNVEVADRVIDSLNQLADARYIRASVEAESLPSLLWTIQVLLGAVMFFGVALIVSGSEELNVTMCLLVTTLIGLNALVIADMDMVYSGFIRLEPTTTYGLLHAVMGAQDEASLGTNLDRRNSNFFRHNGLKISEKTIRKARIAHDNRNGSIFDRFFSGRGKTSVPVAVVDSSSLHDDFKSDLTEKPPPPLFRPEEFAVNSAPRDGGNEQNSSSNDNGTSMFVDQMIEEDL